jgi:hypothetical protein
MGCNIHAHIEVKISGQWHHYSCPPIQRNYRLFARICGVRGDVANAISPPRGIPNDMSVVTIACFDYEKLDSHSATWLTKNELCDLIQWEEAHDPMFHHKEVGYLTGNSFHLSGGNPPEITDVRFICWFDN